MRAGFRFDQIYETMPWNQVDAVVFDIGNVLIRFAPQEFVRALFPDDETEQRHMLERVYNGPEWQEFDRGTLSFEVAARQFHARFGYPEEDYLRTIRECLELKEPIQEGWRAVSRCRLAGKRLYLLSNYSREGYKAVRERFKDRFAQFDGDCISAYYHQIKPERAIYETLLQKFSLEPSRTLFIDDTLPNIERAIEMGIHGFHMHESGMLDRFFCEKD